MISNVFMYLLRARTLNRARAQRRTQFKPYGLSQLPLQGKLCRIDVERIYLRSPFVG